MITTTKQLVEEYIKIDSNWEKTTAFKVFIADLLLKESIITTKEQYLAILEIK